MLDPKIAENYIAILTEELVPATGLSLIHI